MSAGATGPIHSAPLPTCGPIAASSSAPVDSRSLRPDAPAAAHPRGWARELRITRPVRHRVGHQNASAIDQFPRIDPAAPAIPARAHINRMPVCRARVRTISSRQSLARLAVGSRIDAWTVKAVRPTLRGPANRPPSDTSRPRSRPAPETIRQRQRLG